MALCACSLRDRLDGARLLHHASLRVREAHLRPRASIVPDMARLGLIKVEEALALARLVDVLEERLEVVRDARVEEEVALVGEERAYT